VGLPVKFVGVGEKAEDIAPFAPDQFVEALFDEVTVESTSSS
jgi:fused signal recognition particle receptor